MMEICINKNIAFLKKDFRELWILSKRRKKHY